MNNPTVNSAIVEEYQSRKAHLLRVPMAWLELVSGMVLVAIAGFYVYEAELLPDPFNPRAVGAGDFPMIVGLATVAASLFLTLLGVIHLISGKEHKHVTLHRPLSVAFGIAALIGGVLLLEHLGPLVGIATLSLLIMLAGGERRIGYLVAIPAALSGGIYSVFVLLLGVYFS